MTEVKPKKKRPQRTPEQKAARRNGKPVGRPDKYKPEYCELLIEHMGKGFSYDCFSASIPESVTPQTVYAWEKKYPEFFEAKVKAFAENKKFWEQKGLEGLWNQTGVKTFNQKVWMLNMKNRFKWADRQEVVEVSTQHHTVKEEKIDLEDVKKLLKKDPMSGE